MTLGERLSEWAAGILGALVLVVLYAPVVVGALFSVVPYRAGRVFWREATLDWYVQLAHNETVVDALGRTAVVAAVSVAAASVLACALALYVRSDAAILRAPLQGLIYLPFLLPPIVTGLSLLVFFTQLGIRRGMATVVVGHAAYVLSVIFRLVGVRLDALGRSTIEASADLGATAWQTLRHVLLPQMLPAIATGAILAVALSFDETLITVFLAGDVTTLPLRLWAMVRVGFTPQINALVTVVLAASFALAAIVAVRLKPAEREG
jgi:ABC-type spermidine/putrescine transport system permease subunit II